MVLTTAKGKNSERRGEDTPDDSILLGCNEK
jgi:hypothetical protein